jgi:hypothetical protein
MWLPNSFVPFPLQNHLLQFFDLHWTTLLGSWMPQYAQACAGKLLKSNGSIFCIDAASLSASMLLSDYDGVSA